MRKGMIMSKLSGERYVFYTKTDYSERNDFDEHDYKVNVESECSNCNLRQTCPGKRKPIPDGPCYDAYINRKLNKQLARRYAKMNDMLCTAKKRPEYFVSLNSELKLTEKNVKTLKYWLNRFAAKLKVVYPKMWFFYKIEICNKRLLHLHLALRPNKTVYSLVALDELVRTKWQSICKVDKENCSKVTEYSGRLTRMYFTKPSKKNLDKELMIVLRDRNGFGVYGNDYNSTSKEMIYEVDPEYYDKYINPIAFDYVQGLGKYRADGLPNPETVAMLNKGSGALNDISPAFKRNILKALNKYIKRVKKEM